MKHLTWLALAAALIVTGAAPAAASAQRACTAECLAVQWDGQVNPAWAQAKWTANSNTWYERGVAHCQNGRSYALGKGGWVTSFGLWSRAWCPPGYALIGAGWDEKTCSTCSFTRHWSFGHAPVRRP